MTIRDFFYNNRRHRRKTTVYLFLIIITALFIYLYSESLGGSWMPNAPQRLTIYSLYSTSLSTSDANIQERSTYTTYESGSELLTKIFTAVDDHSHDIIHLNKRSTNQKTTSHSTSHQDSSHSTTADQDSSHSKSTTRQYSTYETHTAQKSSSQESTYALLTTDGRTITQSFTTESNDVSPSTNEQASSFTEFTTEEEITLDGEEDTFAKETVTSRGDTDFATEESSSSVTSRDDDDADEISIETRVFASKETRSYHRFTIEPTEKEWLGPETIKESTDFPERYTFTRKGFNKTDVEKGFLVYSSQCKIPDIDPMHSSIKHLVEILPPLDCAEDYAPLTSTRGNRLLLNKTAAETRDFEDFTCCYKSVFRDEDGKSDNKVGFGKKCKKFSKKATVIEDEFIVVECRLENSSVFYKNYHSFIHDKPYVEKRASNDNSKYSVMIIGIDAVSRMNMHRQLNKTKHYLLDNMNAVEMFGFNKVGDNTFPNLIPMMTGYDERELPEVCWKGNQHPLDNCNYLWNEYSKEGFRTLYAEDTPYISSFNYVKRGFYRQPTDYYLRPFMMAYEDDMGRIKPLNCHLCVGSKSETEVVLDWTQLFAQQFARRPYFSFSWINSLTHDFLNMGSSGDHMYERFFRELHESGALDRTVVVLMGDHGMRWGAIRNTYVGRLEERLPMLLVALPPDFEREHSDAAASLRANAHRLVTPFDLHATLKHLLVIDEPFGGLVNGDNVSAELVSNYTERSLSLFEPVPANRSCDEAYIDEHWCTCEMSLPVPTNDTEVQLVAKFLVHHLNFLVGKAAGLCAVLHMENITDARLWQPEVEHHKHSVEDHIYTVVVQTDPGAGIFEGTIRYTPRHEEIDLLGSVSRLNLYGNQSACVSDAILRKYCYCL